MSLLRHDNRVRQELRGIFGAAAEGIGRGIKRGSAFRDRQRQRNLQERRTTLAEREFSLQEEQARRESEQQEQFQRTLASIVDGPQGQQQAPQGPQTVPADERTVAANRAQGRAQGLRIVEQFANLAKMPKSVRGPQVDTLAAQFKQRTGRELAPNVVETLKRGSEKDLTLVARGLARMATEDDQFDVNKAIDILSDPGKSATIFTQAGKMAPVLEQQDETERQAGQTPSEGGTTTQTAASTGGQQQPGPTRERAAARQDGQAGQADAAATETAQAGAFQEVSRLNQTIGRLRQLQGAQGLTSEQRSQVEFAIEQRERQRDSLLQRAEARTLQQISGMEDGTQKAEALRSLERRLLASDAKSGQIERVRDRLSEIEAEAQNPGLNLTNEFQRKAYELFGQRVVNDNKEFDASGLSSEDVGRINSEIGGSSDVVSVSSDFRETALGMFPADRITDEQGRFDVSRLTPEQVNAVNERLKQRRASVQAAGERQNRVNDLLAQKDQQAAKAQTTSRFLRHVQDLPRESFGIRGMLSGLSEVTVGQFFPVTSDVIERFVGGGATEQDRRQVRVQGRKAMSQAIEAVTGEGSNRISEAERQLTERELPNVDRAFNTKQTTVSAFQQIGALQVLASEKSHILARGKPTFDPSDPAEAAAKVQSYMDRFGYSQDEAIDLVEDIATLQGVLER